MGSTAASTYEGDLAEISRDIKILQGKVSGSSYARIAKALGCPAETARRVGPFGSRFEAPAPRHTIFGAGLRKRIDALIQARADMVVEHDAEAGRIKQSGVPTVTRPAKWARPHGFELVMITLPRVPCIDGPPPA